MKAYCLNCDTKITSAKHNRLVIVSSWAICGKKSWGVEEHRVSELLSNLRIRTPLRWIPIIGDLLF